MKVAALPYDTVEASPQIDQTSQHRVTLEIAGRSDYQSLPHKNADDPAGAAEDLSLQKLQHVAEAVDSYVSSMGVHLKFHIDEHTDTVQVEVRDPETDKLIRKIPADEMLELAASMEQMVGILLDKQL